MMTNKNRLPVHMYSDDAAALVHVLLVRCCCCRCLKLLGALRAPADALLSQMGRVLSATLISLTDLIHQLYLPLKHLHMQ